MDSDELAAEADLVASSRRGETQAFDQLITLHRERVHMVAYQILRNHEEALDVAQETFLRAWKNLARFDGSAPLGGHASFRSWLSRIATNAAIDVVRRRQAHPQTEFEAVPMAIDAASRTTPRQAPRPGDSLDRADMRARFEQALGTLSADHRAVILLKEIEDFSYQEIAEAVGCSTGTVMSRLFYARKNCRSNFETFMNNFEERYTAWVDGALDAEERAKFEAEFSDRAAAFEDADRWRKLSEAMRGALEPTPVPHGDFLNSQVLEAIRRETPKVSASTSPRGWFPVGRLAWAGAFLAVVAAVLSYLWVPRNGGMPDEAQFISQVIEARSANPKLGAYAFAAPGGRGAVLWVDDAGFIPANERLK